MKKSSLLILLFLSSVSFSQEKTDTKAQVDPKETVEEKPEAVETGFYRYEIGPYALLSHPELTPLLEQGINLGRLTVLDSAKKFSNSLSFGEIITARRKARETEAATMKSVSSEKPKFAFDRKTDQLPGEEIAREFPVQTARPPVQGALNFSQFQTCLQIEMPKIKSVLSRLSRDDGEWELYSENAGGFPCMRWMGKWKIAQLSAIETYKTVVAIVVRDSESSKRILASLLLLYHPEAPDQSRSMASWALTLQRLQALSPQKIEVESLEKLSAKLYTSGNSPSVEVQGGDTRIEVRNTFSVEQQQRVLKDAREFLAKAGI